MEIQIDHICISLKFRRSWQDVRVMRGADVSSDHDHHLMTTVRLRLKRFTNTSSTRTRYNVGLLRNKDTQAAFQISLSNRFQPLRELTKDDEMEINTLWEHCKKLWHDTCEEVLVKKKMQHKEWISADTIHKLEARRERKSVLNNSRTRTAKAKVQEEYRYTTEDREEKGRIKKDKRDYIDELARRAETAARQGTWGTCTWWPRSWPSNSSWQTSQWRTRTGTHWQQPKNSWNDGQNTSGNCWTTPLLTRHQTSHPQRQNVPSSYLI